MDSILRDGDDDTSVDAFMARIGANIHAQSSSSSPNPNTGAIRLDAVHGLVSLLPAPSTTTTDAVTWTVALVLRYCEDVHAPDTADVFGSAVVGFEKLLAASPRLLDFPFERQLVDFNAVGWACWVAWCMRTRNGAAANRVLKSSLREARAISPAIKAMVLAHVVPGDAAALGFELAAMVFLDGALQLFDEERDVASYQTTYYTRLVAQQCIRAVGGLVVDARDQLSALTLLGDRFRTMKHRADLDEFVLAAAAALTRDGTRLHRPASATEVVRLLSASTRRSSSPFRTLMMSLMSVYVAMPAYADVLLDGVLGDGDATYCLALAVLLPAVHDLSASTLSTKLAPRCLELLRKERRREYRGSGNLPLLSDVFMAMFASTSSLSDDQVAAIGAKLVDSYPPNVPTISLGVSALCGRLGGAALASVLDRLVDRASSSSEDGNASFRALTTSLGTVRLEDVPLVCERVAAAGRAGRAARLGPIKQVVAALTDTTRKEYLVAWFSDLV